MKKGLTRGVIIAAFIVESPLTLAAAGAPSTVASPRTPSSYYYEIGGALPFPIAPNQAPLKWSAGTELKTHFSCGRFSIDLNFAAMFDKLKADITTAATNAIGAGLAALPSYILHRANPDLYDTLQNLMLKLDSLVAFEYLTLLIDKMVGRWVSPRFVMFTELPTS